MEHLRTPLAFAIVCASLLCAAPASATTYYCDNDRSASQYPNCSNYNDRFVYRSGQSGDWNGDDRLGSSGSGAYSWRFQGVGGGNTYNFQAWLNNAAFTTPSAEYGVNSDTIRYINQNTAPGGWNVIGTGLGQWYSSYMFQVLSGGSGRTGADIVRMITYQSAAGAAVREDAIGTPHACGAQPVHDPRIVAIQRRMLDAVDRYDDVQGTFDIAFSNNGQQDTIDFESSPKQRSSFVRVRSRDGRVIERVANGASGMTLYPRQSSFRRTRLIASATPDGPRHYLNSQCEPVFVHRQDPAGADGASDVISPANYAFWLSTSDSEIVGHERLLGRDVTVIRGRHDAYLRAKLNAATFRMWVDDATGVLLKLQGTTPDGRSAYSIDVRGIRFDQELDLKPSLAAPSGWKALSAN